MSGNEFGVSTRHSCILVFEKNTNTANVSFCNFDSWATLPVTGQKDLVVEGVQVGEKVANC